MSEWVTVQNESPVLPSVPYWVVNLRSRELKTPKTNMLGVKSRCGRCYRSVKTVFGIGVPELRHHYTLL